jgi:uncharacterized protein (DUF2252 family)
MMTQLTASGYAYGRSRYVMKAIQASNSGIAAQYLREKYIKMLGSPFVFYRGTNHLYWADLGAEWRVMRFGNAKTRTWLEGDAHAENQGAFNNNEGKVVYGLNDFDSSVIADYQYDLWRFATSLVLVARQNGGFSGKDQDEILDAFSDSYLDTLDSYIGNNKAEKVIYTTKNTYGELRDFLKKVEKDKSRDKQLDEWTKKHKKGRRTFDLSLDDLEPVTEEERVEINAAMDNYKISLSEEVKAQLSFTVEDIAHRLWAGTGSLGTPRFYVLIKGQNKFDKDYHILDVKRQSKPDGYTYLSERDRMEYDIRFDNDAQRQAEAYRGLAKHADNFLGWAQLHNGDYSVRERSPYKKTFPTESLTKRKDFIEMAEQWAMVMATEHTRAAHTIDKCDDGDFQKEVKKLTKGNKKEFRALVREVSFRYADQVESDYGYFKKTMEGK